jgi:hypothetical protein
MTFRIGANFFGWAMETDRYLAPHFEFPSQSGRTGQSCKAGEVETYPCWAKKAFNPVTYCEPDGQSGQSYKSRQTYQTTHKGHRKAKATVAARQDKKAPLAEPKRKAEVTKPEHKAKVIEPDKNGPSETKKGEQDKKFQANAFGVPEFGTGKPEVAPSKDLRPTIKGVPKRTVEQYFQARYQRTLAVQATARGEELLRRAADALLRAKDLDRAKELAGQALTYFDSANAASETAHKLGDRTERNASALSRAIRLHEMAAALARGDIHPGLRTWFVDEGN